MKLPPDVEFHDDIRLLIYRPHGVIDEAAVQRVVDVLEELEEKLQIEIPEDDVMKMNTVGDVLAYVSKV